jgi:hypothetical protein
MKKFKKIVKTNLNFELCSYVFWGYVSAFFLLYAAPLNIVYGFHPDFLSAVFIGAVVWIMIFIIILGLIYLFDRDIYYIEVKE